LINKNQGCGQTNPADARRTPSRYRDNTKADSQVHSPRLIESVTKNT